jgi:hypothetical protein
MTAYRLWILAALCVFVLAVATPGEAPADDAVMLKYNFKEGYSQDYKVKFTQEVFFGTFSRSVFADLEVTERCVGVSEDGKFMMEIVFNKVEASMMMFDKMQESQMGKQLTGQKVAFVVDKHGEVDEIKPVGYIESWQQMESDINAVVNGFYAYLPDKEVTKGESWENTDEQNDDGMHITSQSEYTFKEMKEEKGRNCAQIKSETKTGIGGVNTTPMGEFQAEGEGEGESELYFDPSAGIIVKMKGKMDIKMDMTPVDGGDTVETTVSYQIEKELL